ncbi:MAG: folylpolyglutamate synthase/dihydrofolate synthase family protein [Candidatus Nanosalina sp.]
MTGQVPDTETVSYEKAVEELKSRGSNRKDPAIESTREALQELGRPEEDCSVVLVGGTNGKGSVVEMGSEMLEDLGADTGVYKSPHLVSCRERIKVNGEMISRERFLELYKEIDALDVELSFFEFMTVMAFLQFSRQNVDYALMEVGMGGRLDATNAAEPEVSVVTNIGLDHTEYLGEELEEIAREKSGIIPENGKVVTGATTPPLETVADKRNSDIYRPVRLEEVGSSYRLGEEEFSIPVEGSFQKQNLETAIALVETLESRPRDLEKALSGLECPGRMEYISHKPDYIHDGAHNPPALERIVEDLPEGFVCIFSALETKDISRMIEILERKASRFYLTRSNVEWAAPPEEIARTVDSTPFETLQDPAEAVDRALEKAGPDDTVVVTGSLYLIGDVKKREKG